MGTSREVVFFSQYSTFQMWESSPNVFLKTPWGFLTKNLYFLSHLFQRHIILANLRVTFPQTLSQFFQFLKKHVETSRRYVFFKKTLLTRNEKEVQLFFLRYLGVLWLKMFFRTKLDLTKSEREFSSHVWWPLRWARDTL